MRTRIAQNLAGFGPAGTLVFLAICGASAVFTPAGAALVLVWAWLSLTPSRNIGLVRPGSWMNGLLLGVLLGLSEKFILKAIILPLLGAPPAIAAFGDLAANPRRTPKRAIVWPILKIPSSPIADIRRTEQIGGRAVLWMFLGHR